jgi:hypothetical protein
VWTGRSDGDGSCCQVYPESPWCPRPPGCRIPSVLRKCRPQPLSTAAEAHAAAGEQRRGKGMSCAVAIGGALRRVTLCGVPQRRAEGSRRASTFGERRKQLPQTDALSLTGAGRPWVRGRRRPGSGAARAPRDPGGVTRATHGRPPELSPGSSRPTRDLCRGHRPPLPPSAAQTQGGGAKPTPLRLRGTAGIHVARHRKAETHGGAAVGGASNEAPAPPVQAARREPPARVGDMVEHPPVRGSFGAIPP